MYLYLILLAQLTELFIQAGQMLSVCVCLYAIHGGTNRNHCTQRLVVLHAQTY